MFLSLVLHLRHCLFISTAITSNICIHSKVDIVDPTVAELPCSEEELQRVKQTLKEVHKREACEAYLAANRSEVTSLALCFLQNYQTIRDVFRQFAGKYVLSRVEG